MSADIVRDTQVRPLSFGRYEAMISDAWSFALPSGGVLMSAALRAAQAELADPALRPLSATTTFCSPVPAGPVSIEVSVLRRGRVAAQVRSDLRVAGREELALTCVATFGRDREGQALPELMDQPLPDVPGPEEAPAFDISLGGWCPAFFTQLDIRLALGGVWWAPGFEPGPPRCARWYRYHTAPRLEDGRLDPLAIPPIADTMPAALWQAMGRESRVLHAPSLDLTIHFIEDPVDEWLLVDKHCRRAHSGWEWADAHIHDRTGRLVAFATQAMILRRWKG